MLHCYFYDVTLFMYFMVNKLNFNFNAIFDGELQNRDDDLHKGFQLVEKNSTTTGE
jgi:hypothetical protein